MKIGPKYKLCRRLGSSVFEKCQTQKFALNQEKKAKTMRGGRRNRTNYGVQLLEKQKARFTYGVSERQFKRYVNEALESGESPAEALFRRLENRLDNVVFRMGLATTRRQARQLVSHGHLLVNGRKLTIPSYEVREGDVIKLKDRSKESPLFGQVLEENQNYNPPAWVSFDEKKFEGNIQARPQFDPSTENFDLVKVIEFYSR